MYTDYTDEKEESYYADDDDNNNGFDKEKFKKIVFYILVGVVALVLILLLAKGCSKKQSGTADLPRSTAHPVVSLSVTSKAMEVGESTELVGEVFLASVDNPTITWESLDSRIVKVSDDNGTITAVGEGSAYIIASYKEDGETYTNKCLITVTSSSDQVESMSFEQEKIDLGIGESFLLQLSVSPVTAKIDEIVYESDNSDVAIVDNNGYLYGISLGTTTIHAKTGNVDASITVNVLEKEEGTLVTSLEPTSIKLIKIINGISVGTSSGIDYEILPTNATNNNITWSSQNPSIATVNNGVVTGISAGTTLIIATTENGLSDKISVTVESGQTSVESVSFVGDSNITMEIGGTYQLEYQVTPENATNKNVRYTSSNENVVYVSSSGKIAALASGTSIITISTEDGNKVDIVSVTVKGMGETIEGTTGGDTGSSIGGSTGGDSGYSSGSDYTGGSSSGLESYSSSSCSISSLTLSSNQYSDGARTYNDYWNTDLNKAFTKSSPIPALTVNVYDDCIKSVKYSVWRNSSTSTKKQTVVKTNTSLTKNGSILLGTTDGYYYVEVKITTTGGEELTKHYYSVVKISGSSEVGARSNSYISISQSNNSINGQTTFTVNKLLSTVQKVYYCTTKTGKDCSVSTSNNYLGFTTSSIKKQPKVITYSTTTASSSMGSRACFRARSSSGWLGSQMCFDVQKVTNITSDKTAPTIKMTKDTSLMTNTVRVKITATDTDSGIDTIKYCTINSKSLTSKCDLGKGTVVSNNQYFGVVVSDLTSGQYKIVCARATDKAGNSKDQCNYIYEK